MARCHSQRLGPREYLAGTIPLAFLTAGLGVAGSGLVLPTGTDHPVAAILLLLVGLTLFVSLWLVGWSR